MKATITSEDVAEDMLRKCVDMEGLHFQELLGCQAGYQDV